VWMRHQSGSAKREPPLSAPARFTPGPRGVRLRIPARPAVGLGLEGGVANVIRADGAVVGEGSVRSAAEGGDPHARGPAQIIGGRAVRTGMR